MKIFSEIFQTWNHKTLYYKKTKHSKSSSKNNNKPHNSKHAIKNSPFHQIIITEITEKKNQDHLLLSGSK